MSRSREIDLDEQLEKLERESNRGNQLFEYLVNRTRLRPSYEELCEGYLTLLSNEEGSRGTRLKVLQVLEMLRARDIGLAMIRTTPIGPDVRALWPSQDGHITRHERVKKKVIVVPEFARKSPFFGGVFEKPRDTNDFFTASHEGKPSQEPDKRSIRSIRFKEIKVPVVSPRLPKPQTREMLPRTNEKEEILDFTNAIALHLGFVGNDLAIALDENVGLFLYGPESVCDRRLRGSDFSDYGYYHDKMDAARLFWGPVVRKGVRKEILQLAQSLHGHFETTGPYPSASLWKRWFKILEELVGYEELRRAIESRASEKNVSLTDICLIILPEESLFVLPLAFMGASRGEPLITRLAGISTGLNLVSLKWNVYRYHWYTEPNQHPAGPRCVLFAATGQPPLDLRNEMEEVRRAFGEDKSFIFGDSATQEEFASFYSAGDICWFAGHGIWDVSQCVNVGNQTVPLPIGGPSFSNGPITNWDFITTSNWNFTPIWLTVMNCCLLGRSLLVGPNPMGFISALHNVGSISTMSALLPVKDEAAIILGGTLARTIKRNFRRKDFPRARALSEAVRESSQKKGCEIWDFAPYTLWGLP